ncbi:MAG: ABC transporter ATP-binding protein/permease [Clostridia bacterium]|nr:ABC transporter ATP-binding protein/permease [Clostridia bacterium]
MPGMMGGPRGRQQVVEKLPKGAFAKNIGQLLGTMKPYIVSLVISIVFAAGSTVLAIIAPTWLSNLTDELANGIGVLNGIDMSYIWYCAEILIIFYVGEAVLRYVSSWLMVVVTQRMCKNLRTDISHKINKVPLRYFDNHAFGDTLSVVTNDVDTIGVSLNQSVNMIFNSVFMIIGVLIAMFVVSWQMALAAVCVIPIMIVVLVIIMHFSQPQFRKQQNELGALDGKVEEAYGGQIVIKAFNAEKRTADDFEGTNKKLRKATILSQAISGIMMPVMNVIAYIAYAAVLITGGILMTNGSGAVTYGTIVAFIAYIRLFQSPLTQLAQAFNTLQSAAAAAGRVFDFLKEPEMEDESYKTPQLTEGIRGDVVFDHVCFGYNEDRIIIPDFSATIKAGSKVAIVGPTGAGKTTMVNLLMRFYEVNSGDIRIDGVSIHDMTREEIHDIFGMVLQETWMFEGTLRENILYDKECSDEHLENICKAANISYLVDTLPGGLDYYMETGNELSGGQKQLVTIARSMVENAPMLILDEATSNVDTRTEEIIQEAMDKLTAGRTSFVIAHRLSTIKNADLILVMRDGNIVEQGTHESLMALNGFYANLYNSQFASE